MGWNWRQRRARLLLGVAFVACALALARPANALAGYPLASQGRVILGFGAKYTSTDATSSSTHRGADIAAESGARVQAPFAGTVTFVGRIPAVGGGTVRAVTLSTASGSITLLPLEDVSVAKGDSLADGDAIGSLAGSGDGSCGETHLHIGAKRGDLYVDPMPLLTIPVPAAAPPATSAGPATAPANNTAAITQPGATSAGGVASGAAAKASSAAAHHPVAATAAALQAAPSAPTALLRAVPGARLAPGVSVGGLAPQAGPTVGGVAVQRALAPLRAVGLTASGARAGARVAETALDAALVSARKAAGCAARLGGIAAVAVLGGIGLLWPLWRREEQKGSGEDRVSAITDDVAAAVGR